MSTQDTQRLQDNDTLSRQTGEQEKLPIKLGVSVRCLNVKVRLTFARQLLQTPWRFVPTNITLYFWRQFVTKCNQFRPKSLNIRAKCRAKHLVATGNNSQSKSSGFSSWCQSLRRKRSFIIQVSEALKLVITFTTTWF